MGHGKTDLDIYQEKIVDRKQSQRSHKVKMVGRDDLQPVAASGVLKKKRKRSNERVSIYGNLEIHV